MVDHEWTFLSNHGHVYLLIAQDQDLALREIALKVGITERTAISIVDDLEQAGYIIRQRVGRSNTYRVISGKTLRHPLEKNVKLKKLVELVREARD